jgi:hypothetical protein
VNRLELRCRDAHFPVIGDSETARNRAVTAKIKKGQRIGRNPKTGTEAPNSPRRVIVFTPSAILKQRINGHSRGALRE